MLPYTFGALVVLALVVAAIIELVVGAIKGLMDLPS